MRKLVLACLLAATSALSTGASAAVTLWNGTGANDTISWGQLGGAFTAVSSPANVTSTGGLTATVSDSSGNMERRDQGNGWAGSFAPGEQLLWNQGNGTLTISFDAAVQAAGALIQSDNYGAFAARVTTNDGSFFDILGTADGNGGNTNPFLGVLSDTANITSVTYSLQSNGTSFAIGPLRLIDGPIGAVPEPATWAMMLLGFAGIGMATRRSRRTAATSLHLA